LSYVIIILTDIEVILMAFFSREVTRDKLLVLYLLKVFGIELTRTRLSDSIVTNGWIKYFDLQTCLSELEEDGFIAAIPRPFGQGYRLTERAGEALFMFSSQLPGSLREELSSYAEKNREELRRETQFSAEYSRAQSGGYKVSLKVMETSAVLLQIELLMPERDSAKLVCDNWESGAECIYSFMLNKLMEKK
jgi:hypothetical protein